MKTTVAQLIAVLSAHDSNAVVSAVAGDNGAVNLSVTHAPAIVAVPTVAAVAAAPAPVVAPVPTFRNGQAVVCFGNIYKGFGTVIETLGSGDSTVVRVKKAAGPGVNTKKAMKYNATDLRTGVIVAR